MPESERTLNVSDAALGLAFTASPFPQWVCEPATLRILAVNDAATALYGLPSDEFLSMTPVQLHPVGDQDAARSWLIGPAGPAASFPPRVWRHVTPRGECLVRLACCDVTMPGCAVRLVHVLDVTGEATLQREYEQAVTREAEARLRAALASRSKDAALATVGHELRQPLTPLLAAVAVMEQHISREVGVRAREVIKRQLGVLMRLVDDLLDAARVQQGKITLQRETHDLRRLVEEIVAAHFSDISARGLMFDTHLPSIPVWTSVDSTRFHQILTNLLANAIRHSDTGQRISVRVDAAGGSARVVVSDEGRGVDADVLPHIFEPFAQAEPGANGGLGIGLSVVRALVELHGGQVTASSGGPGRGAEFVVSLPTSAPPVAPVRPFASDLLSAAELIRVCAAADGNPLDGALERSDTALLLADDQSLVLNANHAAFTLIGYSAQDLGSFHVPDILAMDPLGVEDHWRAFVVDGRQEGILVLRRKDGAQVPVRYCALSNVRPGLHLSALEAL